MESTRIFLNMWLCDVTDHDNCNILCDPGHVTPLLSNYKKRKVKDKRNKGIKVIMVKIAHNKYQVLLLRHELR